MAQKITIPFKTVSEAANGALTLAHPNRCSRCGSNNANFYESHRLRLRAGQKRPGFAKRRFPLDKPYTLKIRVCENCYKSDFLVKPDVFDRDAAPLGRAARLYSTGFTIGAVIALIGLLFLTNILSETGILPDSRLYGQIIAAAGLVVVLIIWLLQKQTQNKLRAEFTAAGFDWTRFHRAEVYAPIVENTDDPKAAALLVGFEDETWAIECAEHNQWERESY